MSFNSFLLHRQVLFIWQRYIKKRFFTPGKQEKNKEIIKIPLATKCISFVFGKN